MNDLIIVGIIILVVVGIINLSRKSSLNIRRQHPQSTPDAPSPYVKKKYLFDTTSEFILYKILLELYGDRFHIFPQINYSHVVEVKPMSWSDQRKYRSRIDRKSADFVLCDKDRVVPQLVIELDGSAHTLRNKQLRDEFINDVTKVIGLPILHLHNSHLDKESVRNAVDHELSSVFSS